MKHFSSCLFSVTKMMPKKVKDVMSHAVKLTMVIPLAVMARARHFLRYCKYKCLRSFSVTRQKFEPST